MKLREILLGVLVVMGQAGAWKAGGTPITQGAGDETDARLIALEGKDYFYVLWSEVPGDYRRVVAGKFSVETGEPLWSSPFIVADTGRNQWQHQAAVTPSGDLIIAFQANFALEGGKYSIYATKITPDKTWGWISKWIKLSSVEETEQREPQLCLSSDLGVWVCWTDYRSGQADVWLARITKEGEVRWEVPVCSLSNERERPNLVSSKNGALVFWVEKRNDTLGIFGNRVVEDSFQWGRNGKLLLPYSYGFESLIRPDLPPQYTVTDRSGGAYLFPAHYGVGGVQRVDTLGNLLFDSIPSVAIPYSIASTKDHGVVGCYSLSGGPDVLYQHVKIAKIDSSGARPWGPSFRIWTSPVMDTTWYHDPYCSVVGDYRGGCVVAIGGWQTKEERDIIVVHVDSSGDVEEPIIICDASQDQQNPVIIQNHSTKGYFLVWEDFRNGNWDIYGMTLDSLLKPGIEERKTLKPMLLSLFIAPNPLSKSSVVSYQLPVSGHVQLKVYNTSGQLVKKLVDEWKSSGSYKVFWNRKDEKDKILPSGIYFYELTAKMGRKNQREVKKVVLLKSKGGEK